MRIVGGSARGTSLASPKSDAVRPTSDRIRQAIFNILEHGIDDFSLAGLRVLDLFAGSGALGLEALSRGAGFAVFIDEDVSARGTIRDNVERARMIGRSRISRRDAAQLGPVGKSNAFDLIFADPPYAQGLGTAAIASAATGGWLRPDALLVVEEAKGAEFVWPQAVISVDERKYGDTIIRFGRFDGGKPDDHQI